VVACGLVRSIPERGELGDDDPGLKVVVPSNATESSDLWRPPFATMTGHFLEAKRALRVEDGRARR